MGTLNTTLTDSVSSTTATPAFAASNADRSRAIMFNEFGGPEVLHMTKQPVAEPGPGQVRVRVRIAGVNPVDGAIRTGEIFQVPLPSVPGLDFAGVVDTVGEGVDDAIIGQAVLGLADTGTYADYALTSRFALKPEALSWETAAALPTITETALRVLRQLNIVAGQTLLIHGASGGVGALTVQLATALGATVIGTAGPGNLEYVASLGAIPTPYGPGLVDRAKALAPNGIDAAIDAAGRGAVPDLISLTGEPERVVSIVDFTAPGLGAIFSTGMDATTSPDPFPADLADVAERAANGEVRVRIAQVFSLEEAADAQRLSDSGRANGKLVLTVT